MRKTFNSSFSGVFLAVILIGPACSQTPADHPPRPGSINYVEGQAFIGATAVSPNSAGSLELDRNQSITTQAGKVEILLTPGVFLRIADNGSLTMISLELANTRVQLDKGRALVEVLDFRKENDIRIDANGASTRLLKKGLYDFDADHNEVRVIRGSAQVMAGAGM